MPAQISTRNQILRLLRRSLSSLIGLKLTIFAGLVFLLFGYPQYFDSLPNFRPRDYALGAIGVYSIFALIYSYFGNFSYRRGLSVWVQSNLILMYSVIFYLRINSPLLEIFGYIIDSKLSFIPLLILIFIVNRNLFNQLKNQTYLLVSQVFLVSLSTFSLLNVLKSTYAVNFNYQILFEFFNQPALFWILVTSTLISLLTTLNLKISKFSEVLLFTIIQTTVLASVFNILYSLDITYWYQTLLFLIFWDYLYHPLNSIVHREAETDFSSKLSISTIYHIFLFVIVLYASNNLIFS
jgi:hypothetical protein